MRSRMCLIVGVLILAAFLLIPSIAFAQATATRTLPATVDPGETFTVNVETDLFNGAIVEVLPEGFIYDNNVRHSATGCAPMNVVYHANTHTVDFLYLGVLGLCTPGTFSYDMIASGTPGMYYFSGTITDTNSGNVDNPVGGDTAVEVSGEPQPTPEEVVINEFISDPDTGNECIELFNKEDAAVDLTGWTIEDLTGPDALDGLSIPANGYIALEQGTDYSFLLNNGGDTITLKKGAVVVDTVTYGGGAPNAPVPGTGESAGRYPPNGVDTDVDIDDFFIFTAPTCGAENMVTCAGKTAERTLPGGYINPGDNFDVTVFCDVDAVFGGITETLPPGFTFVGTKTANIAGVTVAGQDITMGWIWTDPGFPPTPWPGIIIYEVTAPMTEGVYDFSGIIAVDNCTITGDTQVTIATGPPTPKVEFSAANYPVNEGGGQIQITVEIDMAPDTDVTVDYATSNGSAASPGDYTATSGQLTFLAGSTAVQTFNVPIIDDMEALEGAETVNLTLSNVQGGPAQLGTQDTATITIADNDVPADQTWVCPAGEIALIAPYPGPGRDRPELTATYPTANLASTADWFQILWLEDEAAQTWQIFDSRMTSGNTLTQLVPGERYYVILSEAGDLMLYL